MRYLRIFFILIVLYPIFSYAADSLDVKMESYKNESYIPTDSLNQINNDLFIPVDSIITIPGVQPIQKDTTNLLQNIPLIPVDSIGLIQVERKNIGDSLSFSQPAIKDSINLILKVQKDTIPRIQYRSVYMDSIEQQNPNFMTKKVIEIKWISEKRDTVIRYKNIVGLNLFYGTYLYGLGGGIYKRLSNDADFIANINFNYVFDNRTTGDLDSNRNITDLEHGSRIYTITLNAGLEKYFLQNRNDWMVKPVLIFGFAPAIIFSTPYSLKLFSSFKKMQLSYGIGVFAALGIDYQAFKKFGINLTARYAFIPVLFGKEVYYYKGFEVKNVGGFYMNLGITLLKQYFRKK